uniref:ABC transporter C family member 2 n=1 Tax=Lygus hesperus TaxID=30085 RepID=A0A0A9WC84_LYGHE
MKWVQMSDCCPTPPTAVDAGIDPDVRVAEVGGGVTIDEAERTAVLSNSGNGYSIAVYSEDGVADTSTTPPEERNVGTVMWRTYYKYIRSMGVTMTCVCFGLITTHAVFDRVTDLWLAVWSNDKHHRSNRYYIGVYSI